MEGQSYSGNENRRDDLAYQAMMNHVICTSVMKNLSPPDLLRCSVVCKLWYSVAYPLIQKSFCRFLTLDHHDDCINLRKLTETLEQSSNNLPFNGLSVLYERPHPPRNPFWVLSHEDRLDSAWEHFCQILQTKLPHLDNLHVNIGSSPSPATVRGAQQVLKTCAPTLKRLSVTSDWFNRSPIVSQKMDTIRALCVAPCENDDEDFWRWANLEKLWQFVQIKPKLEKLWFSSLRQMNGKVRHHLPLDYKQRIRQILKELLERPSLYELSVDVFDIIWLLQENQFPVIRQLTQLTLIVDSFLVTEEGRNVLTQIDFDYFFPNVRHIKFWFASGRYEDADTLLRRVERRRTRFISSRVDTLSFFGEGDTCSVRPIFLQECAKGFKEVKHLWFHKPQKESLLWGLFFRTIFESWSDLDTLTLANTPGSALRDNLDHVFCGLGLDELKLLRTSSIESLENMQFVPCKASIANMKNLRQINIEVNHSSACNFRPQPHPGREVLSALAGALAFSRLPELQLQVFRVGHDDLIPDCWFSLDHLAQYVNNETHDAKLRLNYDA